MYSFTQEAEDVTASGQTAEVNTIGWPVTCKTQIIPGNSVAMNSFWQIWEDRPAPAKMNLKSFSWPGGVRPKI
jgi:hypothetical protein